MMSYGCGVPGCIFLPLLCIGALCGKIFGGITVNFAHLDPELSNTFIALAMIALFTAIVKAPITGKQVAAVVWPDNILLIGIRRGETELIPRGKTVINPSDYLIVLTDEADAAQVQRKLLLLVSGKKS